MNSDTDKYDFRVVAKQTESALTQFGPRVNADYREFKCQFLKWLATSGKNPKRRKEKVDSMW